MHLLQTQVPDVIGRPLRELLRDGERRVRVVRRLGLTTRREHADGLRTGPLRRAAIRFDALSIVIIDEVICKILNGNVLAKVYLVLCLAHLLHLLLLLEHYAHLAVVQLSLAVALKAQFRISGRLVVVISVSA